MSSLNLDKALIDLLEDLRTDFSISFEIKNIDYCEVFQKNETAIIYYNPKIIDTESIVHELLHIWLSRFGCNIGNRIFLSTITNEKLNKVLNKCLCDHINNCCSHVKMYPKYIKMGYTPSKFLINSLAPKVSLKDIREINLQFLGYYNANSLNFFIGSLISILADHLDIDYGEHHPILKNKDNLLYKIITDFWNKWVKFDIENVDPRFNSDYELTDSLIADLTVWTEFKKIK